MIGVLQDKFGEGGNCFAACLASILELELSSVPDFPNEHGDRWLVQLQSWLKPCNLGAILVESEQSWPSGYSVLSKVVSKTGRRHCVVVRDGVQVWDPSPVARELLNGDGWFIAVTVLDPALPTKKPFT